MVWSRSPLCSLVQRASRYARHRAYTAGTRESVYNAAMAFEKVRAMIYNVGNLTGIKGSVSEYVLQSQGYFLSEIPSVRRQKQVLADHLVELIDEVRPDILFLAEIRDESYLDLIKSMFRSHAIDRKYGTSFLASLPVLQGNSSGVFVQHDFPVERHYMSHGTKRLIQEVKIDADTSLFFGHFALGKSARAKQFQEVAQIVKPVKHPIVAGDFNILHGELELDELLARTGLSVVNHPDDKTFPTARPQMALDLFLAPPTIEAVEVAVLHGAQLSDHLPVVADITLRE